MSNQTDKVAVRNLLLLRDRKGLLQWSGRRRNHYRVVMSLVYDSDELVRRRAIEAIGRLAGSQDRHDLEKVRDLIRRLLWLMNDESGGLGWQAPEMIGEILVNVPALIGGYAHLLPAFLDEEPFERGAQQAIYRVATVNPQPFAESAGRLRDSLNDPDPATRVYAALALMAIEADTNGNGIKGLRTDPGKLSWYDFSTGELSRSTVRNEMERVLEQRGPCNRDGDQRFYRNECCRRRMTWQI